MNVCSIHIFFGKETKNLNKMAATMKNILLFGFAVILVIAGLGEVNGAGECGKANPDMEAFKLAPCASAATDENASVSSSCCAAVKKLGQNPKCLCAVMLSNTAKSSGVKPEIAMTIPKRCNIADRPVGYKCGAYTLP
uniref:putative lipid-transfer protein DIR1 n=1 Tax=Erigeron canadensis TaxID=72917 RepID=UPI001CB8E1FC|nr:putative lipid-transfer protein DIR1 [Erigeron canadensis]